VLRLLVNALHSLNGGVLQVAFLYAVSQTFAPKIGKIATLITAINTTSVSAYLTSFYILYSAFCKDGII
jgi:hypothetical protein